ncbi:MAG: class I SAM-dependent methyltransferase, partial [Caldilineaceae bacterium]|nr:class I SAM-dependent methyltransferase [Caldilineaceae bacterium]
MARFSGNEPQLVSAQYATSANLDARIYLHAHFSTNSYGWLPWLFDHLLALPADATILELGCGTGQLWAQNADRIPTGWNLILSDQSPGMLDTASAALAHLSRPLLFEQIDAQHIPYEEGRFDAVIANH